MIAVGSALPSRVVSNDELDRHLGTPDGWIEERTGISERRIASPEDSTASLGTRAAAEALHRAGLTGGDIDLIICATVTPDHRFPASACAIQHALGSKATAYDLNAACSGFLVALSHAHNAIAVGGAGRALVIGAETLSRITDRDDAHTSILFGDGAGAAILEAAPGDPQVGPFTLYTDGGRPQLLYVDPDTDTIHMQGREVYRAAVGGMARAVRETLVRAGLSTDDIDLVIAHQANERILAAVASRIGLPTSKMFTNIRRYGNTSAASIPIALADAYTSGRLRENDTIVLAAFGAGFVFGAALVEWAIPAQVGEPAAGMVTAGV